jgi:hypothetical protein
MSHLNRGNFLGLAGERIAYDAETACANGTSFSSLFIQWKYRALDVHAAGIGGLKPTFYEKGSPVNPFLGFFLLQL